jgi:hypothetical protein
MMAAPIIRMVRSVAMLCFDRWVMAESSITRTLGRPQPADCDPSHRNSGKSGNKGLCRLVYGRGSSLIVALVIVWNAMGGR